LYQRVARLVSGPWNYNKNTMLVAGATFPAELGEIRKIVGDTPLLVPGVGAQGGDVRAVLENGMTADGTGLVINSSRGIIYASNGEDFAEAAGKACQELNTLINSFRK
ncbi:MAG: orotidine 5'-phosphate decarboxylase, partial [Lentisphaeria bacterium]|nr:orotidine 5'-phosphate decarboxylase [Lentisphaeria bacterium]